MGVAKNIISQLLNHVTNNEMVYQFCGELMNISNETEKENKKTLLGYFRRAKRMEVHTKQERLAKDGWPELSDWATDDDVLFLLDGVGVMTCIPKKRPIDNILFAA